MSEAGTPERMDGDAARGTEPRACLDCGLPVQGVYCRHCGQRQTLRPLSLAALLWDLLIEILDTDARVWRTLRTLVLKPGELTLDWTAGRRMRHVPPFRLYLVLNVLTFLVFSLSTDATVFQNDVDEAAYARGEAEIRERLEELEDEEGPAIEQRRAGLRQALVALRSIPDREGAAAEATNGAEDAEAPSDAEAIIDEDDLETSAFLARFGYDQDAILAEMRKIESDPGAFGRRVYERLPTLMFVLLPVFAAVMSLLYLVSGRPYVVHLVGLAHLHAFVFLLLLLMEGFDGFGELVSLMGVPVLPDLFDFLSSGGAATAFFVYLVAWLKRLYGHTTSGAVLMSFLIMLLHVIGLAVGVALLTITTFLLELGS